MYILPEIFDKSISNHLNNPPLVLNNNSLNVMMHKEDNMLRQSLCFITFISIFEDLLFLGKAGKDH